MLSPRDNMKLTKINTDIRQLWFSKKLFDEKRLRINIEMRSAGIVVCAYVSCSPRPASRGSMASIVHSPETTTSYPLVGRVEANPWLLLVAQLDDLCRHIYLFFLYFTIHIAEKYKFKSCFASGIRPSCPNNL